MQRSRSGYLGFGLVLAVLTVIAPADELDEAVSKDRKRIEGTWRVTALDVNGNRANEADANKLTVVNGSDGSWILFSDGKEISRGTTTFNPTRKPKTIDIMATDGDGKGGTYLGIYDLGNKTRTLCFAPLGKERPTEFVSNTGSELILVVFEREKPK